MEINSNKWSLSLDLDGGRIKDLKFDNIPVLGTYNRVDGKMGNTHICAPSFDKEGKEKYNLPFHGYARTLMWNSVHQSANTIEIKTVTSATPEYQAQLELTQRFTLDKTFKHDIEIRHIDGQEVPMNIGVHYYWDTPQGWHPSTLNDQPLMPYISSNGYLDLTQKNTIVFPHATYEMAVRGLHTVALWTAFNTVAHLYNNEFCCIEPIIKWPGYFGKPESFIKPRETVSVSVELQKVV